MAKLSDRHIDFILDDIRAHGITIEDLQFNLLDHICILLEEQLEQIPATAGPEAGPDDSIFMECYTRIIRAFYKEELRELEDEAIFLKGHRPLLVLNRTQFFVLLFAVFIGPFIAYDLNWLISHGEPGNFSIPFEIWGSTLVFALFPLLCLIILLLIPERLDPPIPRKVKILIGIKPFIRILSTGSNPTGATAAVTASPAG